jgi:short-subunit dehydrogenase
MRTAAWPTGSTVLVTGASAGIGRALAEQIAPRAGELILLARRSDRLTALAEQLRTQHPGLRVHPVRCDLADAGDLDAFLARLGIDLPAPEVLVANAGVGDATLFDTADWTRLARLLAVNVTATTRLLHAVVPSMVERGRGGLLIIGSGAGLALLPGSATYTASKHYLHGLTQTLRADLAGTGVTVTEVCPGPVATEFDTGAGIAPSPRGPGRWLRICADQCAADALAGFDRGHAVVFPGRTYGALMHLQAVIPQGCNGWWLPGQHAACGGRAESVPETRHRTAPVPQAIADREASKRGLAAGRMTSTLDSRETLPTAVVHQSARCGVRLTAVRAEVT